MVADDVFRRRIDALPPGEQLAELALEAERRGAETAQSGVVQFTIFRDQGSPVRLYLMTNRVWRQIRTPRPYKTEWNLQIGRPRSKRGPRKGE